ncbi:MAG: hypothetical protein BGO41_12460 [Clostridiales bacterium 38-18]|nr:MAG: hypothetical protein BGO41_12460 [Clostridiales bacterium 38-18]
MLEIENLKVKLNHTEIVRGISFNLEKGKILSVLGESGSGKSVTATSILRLFDENNSEITVDLMRFDEQDLKNLNKGQLEAIRGKRIAYIFQNPIDALSPYRRIGKQFKEVLKSHQLAYHKNEVLKWLEMVGLEKEKEYILRKYPHQLSGGQAQRVTIALALCLNPELIIADEPTSSIDASLTDTIIELLISINQRMKISILFITHDFDLATRISDDILILYGGLVMEYGEKANIVNRPKHPYTEELFKCVSSINSREERLYALSGYALDPKAFKNECPFADRCPQVKKDCYLKIPQITFDSYGTQVRCVLYDEVLNE